MLPDPLHPAVVHLPLALALLMPGLAILWLALMQRGFLPQRAWAVIVLLQALLVASAWLAAETGEEQEHRVEEVVAERHIEAHEEAAERFLLVSVVGLLATGAGLLARRAGAVARLAATLLSFVVLAAGASVGHSGGELVYVHGAASAYTGEQHPEASE